MSSKLFKDDVKFFQRLLKCSGFEPGKIDGIWGSKTDAAANAFDQAFVEIAAAGPVFNLRTEDAIRTLQPEAQRLARQTLKVIRDAGIDARIISGTRTYAEQTALFRQGRFGHPGPIVTNARGGFSNHNFGIAWDLGIFDATGKYLGESPLYKKAGQITTGAGIEDIEWGGNWITFVDQPHYQFDTGLKISEVREKFESGIPFV
jgi:peptidoglycan LD-endopeptidase CwlK